MGSTAPGWTRVDNAVIDRLPEIGAAAWLVYTVLARRMNGAGECWPSVKSIQVDTGLSRRAVQKAVRCLCERGFVRRIEQRRPSGVQCESRYYLSDSIPPDGEGAQNDQGRAHQVRTEQDPIEQDIQNKSRRGGRAVRFTPPLLDEVQAYCRERKNHVDPQRFIDYYETRGWNLKGGGRMKNWQAAVRTWESNGYSSGNSKTGPGQVYDPAAARMPVKGSF